MIKENSEDKDVQYNVVEAGINDRTEQKEKLIKRPTAKALFNNNLYIF